MSPVFIAFIACGLVPLFLIFWEVGIYNKFAGLQCCNDSAMTCNTTREVFSSVVFAGTFGFQPAELFEIEDPTERNAPKVSFN